MDSTIRAGWGLVLALCLLLALLFGLANRAGAAEWTWPVVDCSGRPVTLLDPRYQCTANKAADAGSRVGIDIQFVARFSFGYFDASTGQFFDYLKASKVVSSD